MLGLKIAVTGAMLVVLTAGVIHVKGKKMPPLWVALPLLVVLIGGIAATIGGFLWWVWA